MQGALLTAVACSKGPVKRDEESAARECGTQDEGAQLATATGISNGQPRHCAANQGVVIHPNCMQGGPLSSTSSNNHALTSQRLHKQLQELRVEKDALLRDTEASLGVMMAMSSQVTYFTVHVVFCTLLDPFVAQLVECPDGARFGCISSSAG